MDDVEQLGLFAGPAPKGPEQGTPIELCGWRRAQFSSIEPCVLDRDHDGDHLVWHQGRRDLTVWVVNAETNAGRQVLHARGDRKRFTPLEVRAAVAVADEAFRAE